MYLPSVAGVLLVVLSSLHTTTSVAFRLQTHLHELSCMFGLILAVTCASTKNPASCGILNTHDPESAHYKMGATPFWGGGWERCFCGKQDSLQHHLVAIHHSSHFMFFFPPEHQEIRGEVTIFTTGAGRGRRYGKKKRRKNGIIIHH